MAFYGRYTSNGVENDHIVITNIKNPLFSNVYLPASDILHKQIGVGFFIPTLVYLLTQMDRNCRFTEEPPFYFFVSIASKEPSFIFY